MCIYVIRTETSSNFTAHFHAVTLSDFVYKKSRLHQITLYSFVPYSLALSTSRTLIMDISQLHGMHAHKARNHCPGSICFPPTESQSFHNLVKSLSKRQLSAFPYNTCFKTVKITDMLPGPRFKPWDSQTRNCSCYSRNLIKKYQILTKSVQEWGTGAHWFNILTRCCHLLGRERQLSRDQSPATTSTANISTFSQLSGSFLTNFTFGWTTEN